MDPGQTLKDLLYALHEHEIEDAIEHLENLKTWFEKGGLPPTVGTHREPYTGKTSFIIG